LTASSSEKADIKVVVHDLNTGMQPQLGFSIKSMLGGNSTLFNPGNTTNFIYEILGDGELDIAEINLIDTAPKIANRISAFRARNYKVKFKNIQSPTLQLN
jgi:type II restriction enzyme